MHKQKTLKLLTLSVMTWACWTSSTWRTGDGSATSVGHAAELLVSDRVTNSILRYDVDSGEFLGPLVDGQPETNGGLFLPSAMTYAFDGDLFVTSIDLETGEGKVLRYAPDSGEFLSVFAGGLVGPAGLHYHQASDTLLVGSLGMGLGDSNQIARFTADGTRQPDISEGPVSGRTGMISTDDGTLYASGFAEGTFFTGKVLRYEYDAATDALSYAGEFATANELSGASGLMFDDHGDLLAVSLFGQGVVKFDLEEGAPVGSSVWAQLAYPSALTQAPGGSILVTSLGNDNPNDPIYPEVFPGAVFKFDAATGAMIGQGPFLVRGDAFQPTAILLRPDVGDFDGDGQLTAADIDLLSAAVRDGLQDPRWDLNQDGAINDDDRTNWVVDRKRTYLGDANLDGQFGPSDLIDVLAAGQYEDGVAANSGWATGDWNGDAEFDTSDLVAALQGGGYLAGPRAAVVAVPEPTGALCGLGIALLIGCNRRRLAASCRRT